MRCSHRPSSSPKGNSGVAPVDAGQPPDRRRRRCGATLPNGPLTMGQVVRLPGFARTLRAIVADGRDGFTAVSSGASSSGSAVASMPRGTSAIPSHNGATLWVFRCLATIGGPSPTITGLLDPGQRMDRRARGLPFDPADPLWAHIIVEASPAAGWDRPDVLYDGADGRALLDEAALGRRKRSNQARSGRRPRRRLGTVAGHGTAPPGLATATRPTCAPSTPMASGSHYPIQRPRLRVPRRCRHNGDIPPQPWAGIFAPTGPPRRTRSWPSPAPSLSPMLATTTDGSLSHLVGAMGGDANPRSTSR